MLAAFLAGWTGRSSLDSRPWAASHRFLKHLYNLKFCHVGFVFPYIYVKTDWLVLVKYLQNCILVSRTRALFWWLFKKKCLGLFVCTHKCHEYHWHCILYTVIYIFNIKTVMAKIQKYVFFHSVDSFNLWTDTSKLNRKWDIFRK